MAIEFKTLGEKIELYHNGLKIREHSKRVKLNADGQEYVPMLRGTYIENIPSDLSFYIGNLPQDLSKYSAISIDNSKAGMKILLMSDRVDLTQWNESFSFGSYVDKLDELLVNAASPIQILSDSDFLSKKSYTVLGYGFFSSSGDLVENIMDFKCQISKAEEVAKEMLSRKPISPGVQKSNYRFYERERCSLEEDMNTEFKEVKGRSPKKSIQNVVDEYVISFLNSEGGSIFWGIDDDGVVKSLSLNTEQRDEVRKVVASKINTIEPPITLNETGTFFHEVENSENGFVVEVKVLKSNETGLHYTSSGQTWVRLNGVKQKIQGPKLEKYIRERFLTN